MKKLVWKYPHGKCTTLKIHSKYSELVWIFNRTMYTNSTNDPIKCWEMPSIYGNCRMILTATHLWPSFSKSFKRTNYFWLLEKFMRFLKFLFSLSKCSLPIFVSLETGKEFNFLKSIVERISTYILHL